MSLPEVASREEWLAARKELLAREKELTRQRDALTADRRRLPTVRIGKEYALADAAAAFDVLEHQHIRGKTVLSVRPERAWSEGA